MIRHIRAALAVFLLILITCPLLIVAAIFGTRWPGSAVPRWWNWLVHHVCIRWLMGIRVQMKNEDCVLRSREAGACVYIGNHPKNVGTLVFGYVVACFFGRQLKVVMKREMLRSPIGYSAIRAGSAFPIDRGNSLEALRRIKQEVARLAPGTLLAIFGDTHRPTAKAMRRSHKKYAEERGERYEEVVSRFPHTCVPKYGGACTIFKELIECGESFRAILTVITSDRVEPDSIWQIGSMVGATFFVHYQDVTSEVRQCFAEGKTELDCRRGFKTWMHELWECKVNDLLEADLSKEVDRAA